jgi:hypothetical protein
MAKKKSSGPIYGKASAQKDYDTSRRGDYWFSEEGNIMDNRKDTHGVDESGRARKMQFEDQSKSALEEANSRLESRKVGKKKAKGKEIQQKRTKGKTVARKK